MKLKKCDLCGRETNLTIQISTGEWICRGCNNKIQDDDATNELNLDLPRNVVWIGKVAKMGNARAFFIPKSQRPFLRLHQNYFIVIKEI